MNSTSLHNACCRGDLSVIKFLLDEGADINGKDSVGLSPLHHAVDLTLLSRWFSKNGAGKATVLNFIIDISECMTRMLITRGASVNLKDTKGRTPLHIAASERNNKALSVILENDKNVNVADDKGRIALHYSAHCGNWEGTKMLIDKGSDINATDSDGHIPLHLSVDELHVEVSKLLLQHNSKVNVTNKWLLTPLLIAAGKMDTSIIKPLVDSGADPNTTDSHGQTILHAAVESESIEMLSYILNNLVGPDVNRKNCIGETALNMAVMLKNCDMIKLLLLHGADIDALDNTGETPLHNILIYLYDNENPEMDSKYYAKHLRTVSILLDYHADLTIPTRYKSILDIITSCNLYPIIKQEVLQYICKIKVASHPVSQRYSDSLLLLVDSSFRLRCEKEVELLKSKKVANTSFYEILKVPISKLIFYLRNREIEESLSDGSYKKFVVYSSLIEAKFSLAAHRNNLLKACSPFFSDFTTKPLLTYDCVEYILSFLTIKDLQLLSCCVNN